MLRNDIVTVLREPSTTLPAAPQEQIVQPFDAGNLPRSSVLSRLSKDFHERAGHHLDLQGNDAEPNLKIGNHDLPQNNPQNDYLYLKDYNILAGLLRNNTTLTSVDLSNNALGNVGAQALVDVFRNHASCIELNLAGNNLSQGFIEADHHLEAGHNLILE